jgi:hypothetical protein
MNNLIKLEENKLKSTNDKSKISKGLNINSECSIFDL